MKRLALVPAVLLVALLGTPPPVARATPGGQVWVRRYNDRFNGTDVARSVKVSADNFRLYVAGTSWGGKAAKKDFLTIAYSRAGAKLWTQRYNGPVSGDDGADALVRSPDGSRIYVTGHSVGLHSGEDFATIAYGSAGQMLWLSRYDGPSHSSDTPTSMTISADGTRVYVTGISYNAGTTNDYATVAYDAATGMQLWAARYDSAGHGDDRAYSVAVSRDGTHVYVTGGSPVFNLPSWAPPAITTIAYDSATGAQLWAQRYQGDGNADGAYSPAVLVSVDGTHVYTTGRLSDAGKDRLVTIAYDSSGNQLWAREYSDGANATALALSRDGTRLYVGAFDEAKSSLFLIVAYSSGGQQLWAHRYGVACNGGPAGLVVRADGKRVYLTGPAFGCGNGKDDYTTVSYSSTGAFLWARRYNGPGNGDDDASSLALSPDGSRLYVTGGSWGGNTTHQDFATIAYNTS